MARNQIHISLKQGVSWPGLSTHKSQSRLGLAQFNILEGCYVNQDGHTLNRFPGIAPVFDINYGALTSISQKFFHGFKMMPGGRLMVISEDDYTTAGAGAMADSLFVHVVESFGALGALPGNADFEFEVANRYGKSAQDTGLSHARGQQVMPYKAGLELTEGRLLINVPGYECVFQVPTMNRIVSNNQPQLAYTPRCLGVPKAVLNKFDSNTSEAGGDLDAGKYWVRICYKDQYTGEVGIASEALELDVTGVTTTGSIELVMLWPSEHVPESLALTYVLFVSRKDASKEFMGAVLEFTIQAQASGATRGNVTTTVGSVRLSWSDDKIDMTFPPPVLEQMPTGSKAMKTLRGFTFFGGIQGDYGDDGQFILGPASGTVAVADDPVLLKMNLGNSDPSSKVGFGLGSEVIPPGYAGVEVKAFGAFGTIKYSARFNKIVNQTETILGMGPANAHENVLGSMVHPKLTTINNVGEELIQLNPLRAGIRYSEQSFPNAVSAINRIYMDSDFGEDVEAMGKTSNTLIVCTRNQTYGISFAQTPKGRAPVQLSTRFGSISPNAMVEFDGGAVWLSDRGPVAVMGGSVKWVGIDIKDLFSGTNALYKRDIRGMMGNAIGVHDPERALVMFGVLADYENLTDQYNLTVDKFRQSPSDLLKSTEVAFTTNHNMRVGDIFYLDGFRGFGNDSEFLNGFHRVVTVPDAQTVSIWGLTASSVFVPATGATGYKAGEFTKHGCDEILIWAYHTNSWSTFRMPHGLRAVWLDRVQIDDGSWRTAFMDQNGKIYAFDDEWGDRVKSPNVTVVQMTSANTLNVIGSTEDLLVGHKFMLYDDETQDVLFLNDEIIDFTGDVITMRNSYPDEFASSSLTSPYIMSFGQIDMKIQMESVLPAGDENVPTFSKEIVVRSIEADGFLKARFETESETVDMTPRRMSEIRSNVMQGAVRGHDHRIQVEIIQSANAQVEDIQLMVSQA